MKVYDIRCHEKSMVLTSIDDESIKSHPIESDFDGGSKLEQWTPVEIRTLFKKTYKDFPNYLTGKPVVSATVKKIIEPYIKNQAEFLPLLHEEMELYMMNITNVLDCADWERSKVQLTSKGKFAGFEKLIFDFDKIPEETYIFKLKETAGYSSFMTEALKNVIEKNKLKGLDLSIEYESEFTEEKEQEQLRNFEAALQEIEARKGIEFTYEQARELVDQGKAMVSEKWKMQLDTEGRFWLGQLTLDLTYQWMSPIYIPPILLGQLWYEVDKSDL